MRQPGKTNIHVCLLAVTAVCFSGCAQKSLTPGTAPLPWLASNLPDIPRTDLEQGADQTGASETTQFAQIPIEVSGQARSGRSYTSNCAGHYTLVETRTGRLLGAGRAFNTGAGLVRIDARGQRGAGIGSASDAQTLSFLPDCDCPLWGKPAPPAQMTLPTRAPVCPR